MNFPLLGPQPGMPVLMFHGLCRRVPDYSLFMGGRTCLLAVADFEKIIRRCADRYDLVRIADLEQIASGEWTGRPPLLLTFDDGLASVVDLAMPVLRKHDASAVVFVTTEWTDSNQAPPIFALERVVYERLPVHLSIRVKDRVIGLPIRSRREGLRSFTKLWKMLFRLRIPPHALKREDVFLDGKAWDGLGETGDREFWHPATWEELREGVSEGLIEIGSHMLSHRPLSWLSQEEQSLEFRESAGLLENAFKTPITACAYPHGVYDGQVEALAGDTYRWAFTTARGRLDPKTQATAVPRLHVPGEAPGLVLRELEYGRVARWAARLGF